MSSKTLCFWVRIADIGVAFCALLICAFLLPVQANAMIHEDPMAAGFVWPWIYFLWAVAIPFFVILVYVWKVSTAVKNDQVFTIQTAKWIKTGSLILFADIGLFFLGNAVFAILEMSGPPIVMMSLIIIIFGIAMALCAAVLSRYILKAAALQEENEGTV